MLHRLLKRSVEIDPDRPILECDGSWTTAVELERLASRLASGLAAMGLEEGDRVAFLLPNCLETVVCYLACFRMRLVAVPLDYQYHPLQVGYALGHSGAAILIVDHERVSGLEEVGALGAVPQGGRPLPRSHLQRRPQIPRAGHAHGGRCHADSDVLFASLGAPLPAFAHALGRGKGRLGAEVQC